MYHSQIHIINYINFNLSTEYYILFYFKNYRLDFCNYSKRWNGSPATIVENENEVVWGAIYEIDLCNLDDLDKYVRQNTIIIRKPTLVTFNFLAFL